MIDTEVIGATTQLFTSKPLIMRTFTLITILILILASCNRNRHLTADYEQYVNTHNTVAVLPFDITLIGREIAKKPEDEVLQIKKIESMLFQQSLYVHVLKRTGRRDKDINVSVQDINKTNRLLKDAGVDLINIGEYTPKELGTTLGVDAVISTRLVKEMFMSREEAALVTVATDVLGGFINEKAPSTLLVNKNKLARQSEVDIACTIVDTDSEAPIWIYNTECDIAWNTDADDAVEAINGRIARKFPYRR